MNAPTKLTQCGYVPVTVIVNNLRDAFFNMPAAAKEELARWLQGDHRVDVEAIFRSMPDVAQHDAEVTYINGQVEYVVVSYYHAGARRIFKENIVDALTEEQINAVERQI